MSKPYKALSPAATGIVGLSPGDVIDARYTIEETLRHSPTGTVFAATQHKVDRRVAIKVMDRDAVDDDAVARFMEEAKLVSELGHANIIKVFDFGEDLEHDLLFIVMEYVDAPSLADLLDRGRLRQELATEITHQVCSALAQTHDRDIVHSLIRPSNVLIAPQADGRVHVHLLEVGATHVLPSADADVFPSAQEEVWYASPEQADETVDDIDARSDLYQVGALFYHMLAGRPPFEADSTRELRDAYREEDPVPLAEWVSSEHVHEDIIGLIEQMMVRDRDMRFANALAIRRALESLRDSLELDPPEVESAWLLTDDVTLTVVPAAEEDPEEADEPAPREDAPTEEAASVSEEELPPAHGEDATLIEANAAKETLETAEPDAEADDESSLEDEFFSTALDADDLDREHIFVDEDYPEPETRSRLLIPVFAVVVAFIGGSIFYLVQSDLGREPGPENEEQAAVTAKEDEDAPADPAPTPVANAPTPTPEPEVVDATPSIDEAKRIVLEGTSSAATGMLPAAEATEEIADPAVEEDAPPSAEEKADGAPARAKEKDEGAERTAPEEERPEPAAKASPDDAQKPRPTKKTSTKKKKVDDELKNNMDWLRSNRR